VHHKDLITHIFSQLTTCPIHQFKEAIQKWHIEYLENELSMEDLTPMQPLKMADKKF
jgi:hypothetical protein